MASNVYKSAILSSILAAFFLFPLDQALAHCDGLDGPVVKAAQKALDTGNVNLILIWVPKEDEGDLRTLFKKTLAVRALGPDAKELADMYLFETLVRIHRAGEGEAYTGLKPAGRDLGPAVSGADEALETGKVERLANALSNELQKKLQDQFQRTMAARDYDAEDVDAGRAYVHSYVPFVGYAESVYQAIMKSPGAHPAEAADGTLHK